jgi:hypothetical protein
MKETIGKRRQHKFRKNLAPSYPSSPPSIPPEIDSLYLQKNADLLARISAPFEEQIVTSQTIYKPGLLALARVTFRGTRWQIRHQREIVKIISFPGTGQQPEWENSLIQEWANKKAQPAAESRSLYAVNNHFDFTTEKFDALQDDLMQFLVGKEVLELYYHPYSKLLRRPEETEDNFFDRCLEQIRHDFDQEMKTLDESIVMQQERLREKLERAVRERAENQAEGLNLLENDPEIASLKEEITSLERMRDTKRQEFEGNFAGLARQQEKDLVRCNRSDVEVTRFALLWLPYTEFVIQEQDGRKVELIQSF